MGSDGTVFIGGCVAGLAVGAAAGLLLQWSTTPQTKGSLKHYNEVMHMLNDQLTVPEAGLVRVVEAFSGALQEGLEKDGTELRMLPTYLDRLPKGRERGDFVGIDFKTSSVEVVKLRLDGRGGMAKRTKCYAIPSMVKTGRAATLLGLIASFVADFCPETTEEDTEMLPLGLTFPFPIRQTGMHSGVLLALTKNYNIPELIGTDIMEQMQDAFYEKEVRAHVCALVNDTTAVLLAECLRDPECRVGLVMDEGSNVCYVEELSAITKWNGPPVSGKHMVINTEWGNFSTLPRTKYDIQLDAQSQRPGAEIFEKMVAGLYLGEIVRLVCLDLITRGELFVGNHCPLLATPNALTIAHMMVIEGDTTADLWKVKDLLACQFGLQQKSSFTDRLLVKRVVELVALRAAALTACGLAAIVKRLGSTKRITVGAHGLMCRSYPNFMANVAHNLDLLFPRGHNIKLSVVSNAVVGGAVAAAIANTLAYTDHE